MKKALIYPKDNFRIIEVSNKEFPISPEFFWVDCPDAVEADWEYSDTGFTAPVAPADDRSEWEVTMRQARLALLQANLLKSVQTTIKGSSEAYQIEWEYSSVVRRDSPLVSTVASYLGLTQTEVDNLFIIASSL